MCIGFWLAKSDASGWASHVVDNYLPSIWPIDHACMRGINCFCPLLERFCPLLKLFPHLGSKLLGVQIGPKGCFGVGLGSFCVCIYPRKGGVTAE